MSGCDCEIEIKNNSERKVLFYLLSINAVMFFVEIVSGWLADSSGLIADSLDMMADATVYGIALYAVGRSEIKKVHAAFLNGGMQVLLGAGVILDAARRYITGSDPQSTTMIVISIFALLANVACLAILTKHREGGIHMRATWICSRNDVIANFGVILAGILVAWTGTRTPDIIIGIIISIVVTKGGFDIISESKNALKNIKD